MNIYVDGGCKGNERPGAIGAAAAVFKLRDGRQRSWYKKLPNSPTPTNQRAEITAIIIALEQALKLSESLITNPVLDVTICSDSQYAIRCMNEWIYKWSQNGWMNSAGRKVTNRDLIQTASDLDDRLKEEGDVRYVWIPREDNQDADELCNQVMTEMAEARAKIDNTINMYMYDTDSSDSS